jgi:hypothetical protein
MNIEKRSLLVCASCVIAGNTGVASAALVTIDFESINHQEVLDDQFIADGVDFGGTMVVFNSNLAMSGNKEAFGPPFGATPTRIDAVGNEFSTFGAWFRGDGPGDILTISAFDAAGLLIGTSSIATPPSGLTHGFLNIDTTDTGGQTFAYVQININAIGYSMDDMQFAIVPLPLALNSALMVLGISFAGTALRRRGSRLA